MKLVLVHGFPGFGRLEPVPGFAIEYFSGVEARIKQRFRGVDVLVPELPAVGEGDERAEKLEGAITPFAAGEKVHIIAHSGGGKDARILVSPMKLSRDDLVASITTISTPHHGSVIADLLAQPLALPASFRRRLQPFAAAVKGFTTTEMAKFNVDVPDSTEVQYFSFAGAAQRFDRGVFGSIFFYTYPLILDRDGENDGWVSVRSAAYPRSLTAKVRADHAGEIGHNLSLLKPLDLLFGLPFQHLAFYETLVANLGAVRR